MKKAAYDVEVQTKKAEAELTYELQAAKFGTRLGHVWNMHRKLLGHTLIY